MRKIIPYNSKLKQLARNLRNNSTKSEIILWEELKQRKLKGFKFIRQKPLLYFISDFYCYDLNLVIELDGYSHLHEEVYEKDLFKESELKKYGLTILRFEDEEVLNDLPNVLRTIEDYIVNFTGTEFDGYESV